jgi:hypothetical protein
MINAILVPNIAEGIAKGLFGAAFVALLLFLVIPDASSCGQSTGWSLSTQESENPGEAKCRPQSLSAQ